MRQIYSGKHAQERAEAYVGVREAARMCCRSIQTMRNRRAKDLPPAAVNIGGRVYYPLRELILWIESEKAKDRHYHAAKAKTDTDPDHENEYI